MISYSEGVAQHVKWKLVSAPTGNRLADAHTFSFDSVAALYDGQDPRRLDTYRRRAEVVSARFGLDAREQLVHTVKSYLTDVGASAKALENADRLLDPNSVAVVTGQQAGLFGGPLLTLYKALSTIGLALRMESELGRPVVPVFWIASEDHDWAEVNHAYVIDTLDEVRRIRLQNTVDPHQMVYHTPLTTSDAEQALRDVYEAIGEGPHLTELIKILRDSFEEQMSLSQWFAKMVAYLTQSFGLVLLDPCLPGLRQLVAPVFQAVLRERDRIAHHLTLVYAELDESGFAPEVTRDELNSTLFYVHAGRRYVLERSGQNRLRARTLLEEKTVDEWLELALATPTAFSSNVLCRPVIQDHLIPTLAYVGGPSEIAYHPLSRGVFHALGRTLPPLLLRQRVTIVPPSVSRHMAKWNISTDAIVEPLKLVDPMLQEHGLDELDALFQVLGAEAEGRWAGIAQRFASFGPQAEDIAQRQLTRERDGMKRTRRKLSRLIEVRHDAAVRQLRHIERWLWTDGHLQERRLSVLPFWAKYGIGWIADLPLWDAYDQPGATYIVDLS